MLREVCWSQWEAVRENLKAGGLGGGESEELEKEVVNAKRRDAKAEGKRNDGGGAGEMEEEAQEINLRSQPQPRDAKWIRWLCT